MIQPQPKPAKSIQDESRLVFVRKMPCLLKDHPEHQRACSTSYEGAQFRSEAHHVRKGSQSGVGIKPAATRTVPLCTVAHREYHQIGHDSFCQKYDIDLEKHLILINAEFRSLHPPKTRQGRKKHPGLKSITVQCAACGQKETISAGKIARFGAGLRYQCRKTGKFESVRVA